jgi:TolB-like protein
MTRVTPRLGRCVSIFLLMSAVSSRPLLAQDMKPLSSTLARNISAAGRKTVAVIDFTDLQGNVTELGRFLAEELSIALVNDAKGFEVIDRTHLKVILQEHRLATTGLIDPQTARKLGQIAGVDTLVSATITPLGDSIRISAKVLDTDTAKMVAASATDIPKTKAIEDLLNKGVSTVRGGTLSGASETPNQSAAKLPNFETESYRVNIGSVRKSGSNIAVTLTFENVSEKKVLLAWGGFSFGTPSNEGPYLLDENGEKWLLLANDEARIVWHSGFGPVDLPPGTRIKTKFVFGGSGQGKLFTLVCTEGAPKSGREIVIHGLTPD